MRICNVPLDEPGRAAEEALDRHVRIWLRRGAGVAALADLDGDQTDIALLMAGWFGDGWEQLEDWRIER